MKLNIRLYIGLLMSLFLASGCNHGRKIINNPIDFTTVKMDTVAHLFNDTVKPACRFSLEMQYPSSASNEKDLVIIQHIFSDAFFGTEYHQLTPIQAGHKYMQTYVANYHQLEKDYEMLKQQEEEGWGMESFNYEEKISSDIQFNANDFLSFSVKEYAFTGGAHGMNSTTNHVIDLRTKTLLTLEDLFTSSSLPDIGKLIIETIAAEHKYKDPAELNDDGFFNIEEVLPTDNFIIDQKGITWVYNPYEIAVYATGQVQVTLEWALVKPYLIEGSPVMKLASISEK